MVTIVLLTFIHSYSYNIFLAVCHNRVQLTQMYRNLQKTTNKSALNATLRSPVKVNLQRFLSSNAHDHSKVWVIEKGVSLGLLAVIPAAFLCQNSYLDYALALSLVAHIHWGLEAIVVDYIRPSLFGAVVPKAALGGLYLLSIVALAGLFYLNYSDVGLSTAIRMIIKA